MRNNQGYCLNKKISKEFKENFKAQKFGTLFGIVKIISQKTLFLKVMGGKKKEKKEKGRTSQHWLMHVDG